MSKLTNFDEAKIVTFLHIKTLIFSPGTLVMRANSC